MSAFSSIETVVAAIRRGEMVILVDDEDRENEGDLVCAAQFITPQVVNFMLREARGVLCVALTGEDCERLSLYPQAPFNTAPLGTAFTVTVDAHPRFGITTGVSAAERAKTIQVIIDPKSRPDDLCRPGHINPLRARTGGVLERAGQTEGSVDLAKLAGLHPSGVIIEIMSDDGSMARLPQLKAFADKHHLNLCSIADIIQYRLRQETLIRRIAQQPLATQWGRFDLIVYETMHDPLLHIALTCGGIGVRDQNTGRVPFQTTPTLVRMHSENLLSDVFKGDDSPSGKELQASMEIIAKAGSGVVVYLRQESRGLALLSRLKEFQTAAGPTPQIGEALANPMGRRDFGVGAQILRDLGLSELVLLTNRPKKLHGLEAFGLHVIDQRPIQY
jgi:3,4-dihydroxy 2-butanone 4-phosphate synthase/GTP cyclohydrolase II